MSFSLKTTTLLVGTAVALAPLVSTRAQPAVPMTSSEQVTVESIQPAACRGGVVFAGQDRDRGTEPWITDGTPAGTRRLKDIWPGPRFSMPSGFATLGDRVVFWAEDAAHGREPWITDGTEAGTVLLKDLVPGERPGSVGGFDPNALEVGQTAVFHGALYFFGRNEDGRPAVYRTDGTEAGTICLDATQGGLGELFAAEDGVYFFEPYRAPWKTDGVHAGPVCGANVVHKGYLPDAVMSDEFNPPDRPMSMRPVSRGRTVFFIGDTDAAGLELWRTDGSTGGTMMVRDIRKGFGAGYDKSDRCSFPQWLTIFKNEVYFVATDDVDKERGRELWKTDGTEAGTMMVKDINPGKASSNPASLVVWNNALYFTAKSNPRNPRERGLWKTDGTENGTVPLRGVSYFPLAKAKAQAPTWPLAWPVVLRGDLYTAVNPYGWFGVVRARPGAKGFEIVCGPPIVNVSWPTAYGNPRWILCDDGVVFTAEKRLWRCAAPTDRR